MAAGDDPLPSWEGSLAAGAELDALEIVTVITADESFRPPCRNCDRWLPGSRDDPGRPWYRRLGRAKKPAVATSLAEAGWSPARRESAGEQLETIAAAGLPTGSGLHDFLEAFDGLHVTEADGRSVLRLDCRTALARATLDVVDEIAARLGSPAVPIGTGSTDHLLVFRQQTGALVGWLDGQLWPLGGDPHEAIADLTATATTT